MKFIEFIKTHIGIFMIIFGALGALASFWAMFFAFHITPYGHDWAYLPEAVTGIGFTLLGLWVLMMGWNITFKTRNRY